ncbi:MAG: bis(5'-nucleosyl)-tetraphosphatase (symmetrical) YqeK [Candidatus Hydrogenedentes bacterium]|nr:bis(5'-nucleosyl)-tetraphosphatase (symmetrical) YqeK [Candidatus Hydrogenedentota bacterium]
MSALSIPRADEFVARLRGRLSENRVRHCVSVAETMWQVASENGLDTNRAAVAGFLHDMCKAFTPADMLAAADRYRISINETQRKKPSLLHGHVAAHEAKHDLGVDHDDVHEAIAWHVTGYPNVGPLALALYYADFSEPYRDFEEAEVARDIYQKDGLRTAVRYVARAKTERLVTKRMLIDPNTDAFRAWLETAPA